jgi:hypothetical protein
VSNAEVVVDPEGSLLPGVERRIPFSLTAADRQATVFLLSVAPWVFDFWIETPQGAKLDPPAAQVLPGVTFTQGQRVHLYRFTLPVPLGQGAHQGTWHAVLCISKEDFKKYVSGKRVRSAAAHGIAYSVNVHAFSSLRMHAEAAQNSMEPGAKLDLRVSLTEADLPVERRAYVRADVVLPSGIAQTVALAEAAPGSFEASMIAAAPGIYQIRFRAWGTTLRGFPFTREQLRTPAVWRGGDNPPPTPPAGGSDADWCRFIECLLQQKGLAAWMEKAGFSRDELLECWKASCRRR